MTTAPTTRLRHSTQALAHSVSVPAWRAAFTLRPADAWLAPAMKVGVAATLVLVLGGLLGFEQLAGIASLGALTSAFGRYQPYKVLARQLGLVAAALLISTTLGALMGASGTVMWVQIVVLSATAALASLVLSAFRITGPGPVILVFAAGAGAGYAHSYAAVPEAMAAVSIGAVVGWLVALSPVLIVPLGPARLATARAIAAVARCEKHDDDAHRAAAAAAVRGARESVAHSVGGRGQVSSDSARAQTLRAQGRQLTGLLDEAESALGLVGTAPGTAAVAALLRHEGELRRIRRTLDVPSPGRAVTEAPVPFFASSRAGLSSRPAVKQALRIAVASALAGLAAVVLGFGHPLWASMGAVAALQSVNYSITVQRGIQRLVGNVVGAVLAAGLLSLSLGFWPSVIAVIIFQTAAELLVLKNYTLTTIAVTPMALIMTGMGAHLSPDVAMSRVLDTLVGVVVGVIVAAVSISLADRHHLPKTV
jgi:hypothetical protein